MAYQLREGINAAKSFSVVDPAFKEYAKLLARFVMRVRAGKVVAEPRDALPNPVATLARMQIDDAKTLYEVIGAAIKHKAHEMHFPNARLDNGELDKLWLWAESTDYAIIRSDEGLTLTMNDVEEFKWKPPSVQKLSTG